MKPKVEVVEEPKASAALSPPDALLEPEIAISETVEVAPAAKPVHAIRVTHFADAVDENGKDVRIIAGSEVVTLLSLRQRLAGLEARRATIERQIADVQDVIARAQIASDGVDGGG